MQEITIELHGVFIILRNSVNQGSNRDDLYLLLHMLDFSWETQRLEAKIV